VLTRVLSILAALAGVALLVAACGGMSASDYMSKLEDTARADLKALKDNQATASDDAAARIAKTEKYLAVGLDAQRKLQQITPPPDFASAHSKVLISYERGIAMMRSMIEALKANDSEAYTAAYQEGSSALFAANEAAIDALSAAADKA
jgi:hypothetical protein